MRIALLALALAATAQAAERESPDRSTFAICHGKRCVDAHAPMIVTGDYRLAADGWRDR